MEVERAIIVTEFPPAFKFAWDDILNSSGGVEFCNELSEVV
jgi:hypothetical protein